MEGMFVSSQNSYVEILTPKVMVLGRALGHESGALVNGISALIKRPQRALSLSFQHVRRIQ